MARTLADLVATCRLTDDIDEIGTIAVIRMLGAERKGDHARKKFYERHSHGYAQLANLLDNLEQEIAADVGQLSNEQQPESKRRRIGRG